MKYNNDIPNNHSSINSLIKSGIYHLYNSLKHLINMELELIYIIIMIIIW